MSTNDFPVTPMSIEAAKWEAAAERQLMAAQIAEAEGVDKLAMMALADMHGAEFLRVYLERKAAA